MLLGVLVIIMTCVQGSSSGHNNSHHNGRQDRRPGDRDGATDRDRRERPGRDQPDPWTSWQRSKSTEREPPPKRDKRDASGAGPSRDRDGRTERRDERRPEADRRPGDRADRDRRDKREVEERRKRDEMRKVDERRREEEKRLEEIKRREAEIRREEEKLRRMEEESRREVQRRRDEERRREEERKRNEERDRERRRREEQRRRSPSPRHRVQRKSPPTRQRRERSAERRHSSSNKQSTSRRRSTSSSRRQSALDRLGPKIPVVTRLGGGKVSRKRRRPGSNERYVCHLRHLQLRVIGRENKKTNQTSFNSCISTAEKTDPSRIWLSRHFLQLLLMNQNASCRGLRRKIQNTSKIESLNTKKITKHSHFLVAILIKFGLI